MSQVTGISAISLNGQLGNEEHFKNKWVVFNRKAVLLSGLFLLTLIVLSVATPSHASGTIRYVDHAYGYDSGNTCTSANSPCQSIQQAVDVAQPFDIIKVTGGLYYENIVIDRNKPELTIEGGWGLPGQGFTYRNVDACITEISGSGKGPVFHLEAASCFIGLTIDGCWLVDGSADNGGAIFAKALNDPYVSPMASNGIIKLTLSNCSLENNTAVFDGGAVYALAEEPLAGLSNNNVEVSLADSVITFNETLDGYGGAIAVESYGSSKSGVTLKNNQILANTAASDGGGIYMKHDGKGTVKINMENNIVADNSARSGGGLMVKGYVEFYSVNDTIANNRSGNRGICGGVYLNNYPRSKFTNTILWGNSSHGSPSDVFIGWATDLSKVTFSHSDIGMVYEHGYFADITGNGNVSVDPGFISPATGDFRLRQDSPVLKAGICGSFVSGYKTRVAPIEDFEGDRRANPGAVQCKSYRYDWRTGKYTCYQGTYIGCSIGADDQHSPIKLWNGSKKLNPGKSIPFP